jgi:UDP-3-O-[3-hydroxymyristoyl] glucosamine N-acyltransferase
MQTTLAELAALVDGQLVGEADLTIEGVMPLCNAQSGDITMVDGDEKNQSLENCSATAIISPRTFLPKDIPTIQVDDVHVAFAAIIEHFRPPRQRRRIGISPLAIVSPSAMLGEDVDVHPFAQIGDDVRIGTGSTIHGGVNIMAGSQVGCNVTIFPNAVLYEDTQVGDRSIIHANAVLGAFGFGYDFVDNHHQLSSQYGNTVLGDDVEIGAGTTIDRGTYGPTTVGDGTKIDDQVMVGHNCQLGRHNMLCSQVGIAGSTTSGDYVVMAGQVGVRDHVHIGTGAVLGAMAGITNDVPEGIRVIGAPATPERDQKLKLAALSKLPEMRRQMKKLQRVVNELAAQAASETLPNNSDDGTDRRAVA